jgi:hypothetical protein
MVSIPYLHPSGTQAVPSRGPAEAIGDIVGERRVRWIPPPFKLHASRRRSSSSSLDRGAGGEVDVLGLLGGGLNGLSDLLDDGGGSLLNGSGGLGGGLLSLDLGLSSRSLLLVELHSLAGLAEQTTKLGGLGLALLGLAIGDLVVGGVGLLLLLAEVAEERGAALVLGGGGLSGGLLGLLSSLGDLSVGSGGDSLGLNGLDSGLLDGVLELRSSAGDGGLLSGGGGLLLRFLVGGAGDLLEEVAEDGSALGLLLFLLLLLGLLGGLVLDGLSGSSSWRKC